MHAILTVEAGQAEPMVCELPSGKLTTLGRNKKNTVILHDEHASRRHAHIVFDEGRWVLRDLDTLNGTRLNGKPVQQQVLESNHIITIGRTRFRFTVGETATSTPALPDPTAEMPTLVPAPVHESSELQRTILAADELTALCEFMEVSVKESDPRTLVRLALEAILRQTNAEVTGYLSLDETEPMPKLIVPDQGEVDVRLSRKLTQEVQRAGKTVWLRERGRGAPQSDSILSLKDAICVPLREGDTYLGALHNYVSTRQFSERDVRFCEVLAGHLANSLSLLRNRRNLEAENIRLRRRTSESNRLIGDSRVMQQLRAKISRAAASPSTALILGESGSGKELVAQALHEQSARRRGPFVTHNCAAVNTTLLESDLFGHVKGAFTGADADRPGLFRLADEGTLFLDEIGEMPLDCQAKVLRVIEGCGLRPVGGTSLVKPDVRILAATNRNLEEEVEKGRFRPDLYYRLCVLPLPVPPLRDRIEDIPALVEYFLDTFPEPNGRRVRASEAAIRRLQEYSWPGNVRQLRTALERALVFCESDVLQPSDLILDKHAAPRQLPTVNMEELETLAIQQAMEQTNGNVTHSAKLLGMSRDTLTNKLKKIPHTRPEGRREPEE